MYLTRAPLFSVCLMLHGVCVCVRFHAPFGANAVPFLAEAMWSWVLIMCVVHMNDALWLMRGRFVAESRRSGGLLEGLPQYHPPRTLISLVSTASLYLSRSLSCPPNKGLTPPSCIAASLPLIPSVCLPAFLPPSKDHSDQEPQQGQG